MERRISGSNSSSIGPSTPSTSTSPPSSPPPSPVTASGAQLKEILPNHSYKLLRLALKFLLVLLLVNYLMPSVISTCRVSVQHRLQFYEAENRDHTYEFLRTFMTFWLVRALLTLQLFYAIWKSPNWEPVGVVFFTIFVAYFPGLYLLESLKAGSSDSECSEQRGNGYSGHTFFYTWVLSSVYFFTCYIRNIVAARKSRAESSSNSGSLNLNHLQYNDGLDSNNNGNVANHNSKELLNKETEKMWDRITWAIEGFAFILILPSALITYWHGHHTIYQMMLGSIASLLWNSVLFWILRRFHYLRYYIEDVRPPRRLRSKSL